MVPNIRQQIRLTPSTRALINLECDATGESISTVVRRAITQAYHGRMNTPGYAAEYNRVLIEIGADSPIGSTDV